MDYLISDTHFHHARILEHEKESRGHFANVEEMDNYLINAWNRIIKPNDKVYHLGDVALYMNYEKLTDLFTKLRGKKHIIIGNHDDERLYRKLKENNFIEDYTVVGIQIKNAKQTLMLTHYPVDIGFQKNMWSVHGHIHSMESKQPYQLNISVDSPFLRRIQHPFGEPIAVSTLVDYMLSNPLKKSDYYS